ncbi:MAG: hypothetical protein ABIO71_14350 [Caldimonas sp.]
MIAAVRFPALALAVALVTACAPMITVQPARLDTASGAAAPEAIVVRDALDFRLPTGYSRTLPAASRWRRVGRLAQGEVYRPVDFVFSIEGRQVHEAYLVVAERRLVGFYLPGESTFSPLVATLPLALGDLP